MTTSVFLLNLASLPFKGGVLGISWIHPHNSPAQGIFLCTFQPYSDAMSDENALDNFFIYPRVSKHDHVKQAILQLDEFKSELQLESRAAFIDLVRRSEKFHGLAALHPRLTPFEYLLLTMLIEHKKEMTRLEIDFDLLSSGWTHPPFP
jgi:hypothetical protein